MIMIDATTMIVTCEYVNEYDISGDIEDTKDIIKQFIDEKGLLWDTEDPLFLKQNESPSSSKGILENIDNSELVDIVKIEYDCDSSGVSSSELCKTECNNPNEEEKVCKNGTCQSIQMDEGIPKKNMVDDDMEKTDGKNLECTPCITAEKFKCSMCNYATDKKQYLNRHIDRAHMKEKNYYCPMCDYSTSRKDCLKFHIQENHQTVDHFKCHQCDYSTARKSRLTSHVSSVHLGIRNHHCHLCDFKTTRKNTLTGHISSIHLKLKDQKCHLCDFMTSRKSALKRHIDACHIKKKTYDCHLCTFRSYLKANLKTHIDGVHLKIKNQKCHLCDFSTFRAQSLRIHINKVHKKETKVRSYKDLTLD